MARLALLSLVVASDLATGFQGMRQLPQPHLARSQKPSATQLDALPVVARSIAAPPVLYALMSFNEYITHRWFQHAEFNGSRGQRWLGALMRPFGKEKPTIRGGGHVEHHAETLDDMSLKVDARWRSRAAALSLDSDPYRGTAFTWVVSGLMTVQMSLTTVPLFKAMGFGLKATYAWLMPAMLIHALLWNALHPNMHALPDVPFSDGAPSWVLAPLRSSWAFKWLYTNHEGHHIVGGRGNYNVACPLADHVLGTFIPEKTWRPKASTTYESYHKEAASLEDQIQAHITREAGKKAALEAPAGLVIAADSADAAPVPIVEVLFDEEKDLQVSR